MVAGRYRLFELVGRGGMGRVWRARDELLHREVAVKQVVPPSWLTEDESTELRARALREARTAARVDHPNVVRVYDVVRFGDSPWIVMEYVPSRSLQDILDAEGPLPPARAASVGLALLAGLRAAHGAGVLHRDVKPQNVLVAPDGRVLLTDFGLAVFDGGDGAMTRPGMVLGSPQYVAPERAADGVSSVAADLWSLGATLYAAVEGQSPYARASAMATLSALASGPPDPVRRAGPLAPALAGLLRRDPAQRTDHEETRRRLARAAGEPAAGRQPATVPADAERTLPLARGAGPRPTAGQAIDSTARHTVPPAPPPTRPAVRPAGETPRALPATPVVGRPADETPRALPAAPVVGRLGAAPRAAAVSPALDDAPTVPQRPGARPQISGLDPDEAPTAPQHPHTSAATVPAPTSPAPTSPAPTDPPADTDEAPTVPQHSPTLRAVAAPAPTSPAPTGAPADTDEAPTVRQHSPTLRVPAAPAPDDLAPTDADEAPTVPQHPHAGTATVPAPPGTDASTGPDEAPTVPHRSRVPRRATAGTDPPGAENAPTVPHRFVAASRVPGGPDRGEVGRRPVGRWALAGTALLVAVAAGVGTALTLVGRGTDPPATTPLTVGAPGGQPDDRPEKRGPRGRAPGDPRAALTGAGYDAGQGRPGPPPGGRPPPPFPCVRPDVVGTPVDAATAPAEASFRPPTGWVWHAGDGFHVAVPAGWRYSRDGDVSCFQDPETGRALSVVPSGDTTVGALDRLRAARARAQKAATLPGYTEFRLAPTVDAAEWECAWDTPDGGRLRALQVVPDLPAGSRSFTLGWITRDTDWTAAADQLDTVRTSLRPSG
ncbi:serine/threonine protein kinase [Micromonospora endolithica]|uniref:non-specific serine/threonine protein kinase n=1 Tax=Micromonospora endolithica TaxID=230091 RepID=A0A3A9ZT15_9ACTN|nr:serine/threonine protein kinase [Micromonospora endolithica]